MTRLTIPRQGALALAFIAGLSGQALAQSRGNPSFNVVNRSGQVIEQLFASSAQQNTWGRDLLGNDVLADGGSFAVRLPAGQCTNDVRVVYQGGRSEERRGIDTCRTNEVVFGQQGQGGGRSADGKRGGAAQPGRSGNPSFNLVNRTNKTIQVLRASPGSDSNWGEDRLGNSTVPPGGRFAIRLPAGECNYDVRVEYENRSAEEVHGVDLCSVTDVTFPDRG
ncbi:hypothetical protein [Roseomonas populi]|uniref:Uncharacterized protein n=1 Tax=Roseomonas populi TaxID=3121582 RepID=A0ABT1WYA2_9PROT|nr:hypothetical protein [Roseomonas pecuniae]MCR0980817.1 hypothetical protein [Roseomonas pecuniae]